MKDFNKKIARFVELSKEFTTSEDEVYEGFEPQYQNVTIGYSSTSDYNTIVFNSQPTCSKSIQYEIYLEQQLNRTRRYEEYKILQADLSAYFQATEKLSSGDENVEGRV